MLDFIQLWSKREDRGQRVPSGFVGSYRFCVPRSSTRGTPWPVHGHGTSLRGPSGPVPSTGPTSRNRTPDINGRSGGDGGGGLPGNTGGYHGYTCTRGRIWTVHTHSRSRRPVGREEIGTGIDRGHQWMCSLEGSPGPRDRGSGRISWSE